VLVSEYTNYGKKIKKQAFLQVKIEKIFSSGDTMYVSVYSEI
jgi:hypothetical protein